MGSDQNQIEEELEVIQAKIEGIIEDDKGRYDVQLENLTNAEVLTLTSVFRQGVELYASQGADAQARFVHNLDEQVREQASPLFEKLDEIHEPLAEEIQKQEVEDTSSPKEAGSIWAPPFFSGSSSSPANRAWRVGGMLVFVQAALAIAYAVSLITSAALDVSMGSVLFTAGLSVTGFLAALLMTFSLGFGYARYQSSVNPN